MRPPLPFRIALALACVLLTSGCVSSMLADRMLRAPNRQATPRMLGQLAEMQRVLDTRYFALSTRVRVAPDGTELAVAVIEPGDYQLKHELKTVPRGPDKAGISLAFSLHPRAADAPALAPKGTIFVLHGVMMAKESMLHWAFFLAQEGYRVVLVDLRGHGRSTGDLITYGARECSDLAQVLDDLARRDLVTGRLGVLGLSYGGALAIQWAASDPRIDAVVALAPFSDPRKAIGEFARAVMPKTSALISADNLTNAFVTAARRGNFTWEEIDVLAAARRLRFPILLFHGADDTWIPRRHSEAIKAAAPAGTRLRTGPGDHVTISLILEPIAGHVSAWFGRSLAAPAEPSRVSLLNPVLPPAPSLPVPP